MKQTSEDSLKKTFFPKFKLLIQGAAYLWLFTVCIGKYSSVLDLLVEFIK